MSWSRPDMYRVGVGCFWQWGLPLRPSVGDVRVDDMLQGRRGRAVFSKIVRNPTLPVDPLQPGSWWPGVTEQP